MLAHILSLSSLVGDQYIALADALYWPIFGFFLWLLFWQYWELSYWLCTVC